MSLIDNKYLSNKLNSKENASLDLNKKSFESNLFQELKYESDKIESDVEEKLLEYISDYILDDIYRANSLNKTQLSFCIDSSVIGEVRCSVLERIFNLEGVHANAFEYGTKSYVYNLDWNEKHSLCDNQNSLFDILYKQRLELLEVKKQNLHDYFYSDIIPRIKESNAKGLKKLIYTLPSDYNKDKCFKDYIRTLLEKENILCSISDDKIIIRWDISFNEYQNRQIEERRHKRDERLKSFYKKPNKDLFLEINSFFILSFLVSALIVAVILFMLIPCVIIYPDIDINPIVVFIASLFVGIINFTLFACLIFIVDTIRCKINNSLLHNEKDVHSGYIKYIYNFIKEYYKNSKIFLTKVFVGSWIFNFIVASINDLFITDIYFIGVIVSSFVFSIFSTILFRCYVDYIYSRVKNEYDIFE